VDVMPLEAELAVIPQPLLTQFLVELLVVLEAAIAVEAAIDESDAERCGELNRDPASPMGIE